MHGAHQVDTYDAEKFVERLLQRAADTASAGGMDQLIGRAEVAFDRLNGRGDGRGVGDISGVGAHVG